MKPHPPPHNSLLLSKDLQDISKRGLEAAIDDVENSSSSSSPPLQHLTSSHDPNSSIRLSSKPSSGVPGCAAEDVDSPSSLNQPPSLAATELELLAGLEEEMRNISKLTDNIDRSTMEVSAALDHQDLAYRMHAAQDEASSRRESSISSNWNQTSVHTSYQVRGYPSHPVHSSLPPPRPPLPRSSISPPPRPPLPVSPRPSSLSPSPGPESMHHLSSLPAEPLPPHTAETAKLSPLQSVPQLSSLSSAQPLPNPLVLQDVSGPSSWEDNRQMPRPPPPSPLTPSGNDVFSSSAVIESDSVRSGASRRRNKQ